MQTFLIDISLVKRARAVVSPDVRTQPPRA